MEENWIVIPAKARDSLCWEGETLVDWVAGGLRYYLDGTLQERAVIYPYRFDAACVSPSGRFAVIYERMGTKGLVLDRGEIRREINRSYYHADVYDYPVTLFTLPGGREALAHCPEEYNELQIELLETGERLTPRPAGNAADFFHSRLAVDPTGEWLLSAGWIWHPFDSISLYSISEALAAPLCLDRDSTLPGQVVEVSSAAFASNSRLILTSRADANDFSKPDEEIRRLRPGSIAVCDLATRSYLSVAPLEEEAGTVMPVGTEHVIGFYDHPKLIHLESGRVVRRWPDLDTGKQLSSISSQAGPLPPLALDPARGRFAVANDEAITVVTLADTLPEPS